MTDALFLAVRSVPVESEPADLYQAQGVTVRTRQESRIATDYFFLFIFFLPFRFRLVGLCAGSAKNIFQLAYHHSLAGL